MTSFVKKQGNIGMEIQSLRHQQSDRARRFYLIQKYADFLSKEIKEMSLPWEPLPCYSGYFMMADISKCRPLIP